MLLRENYSLKPHNTFGIESTAKRYIELHSRDEAWNFFKNNSLRYDEILILGAGSNILFISDFPGIVVHYTPSHFSIVKEDCDHVWLAGDAGINWNDFVSLSLNMGYQGLENLTLIPGTLGAAPVQNIGAYGVELGNFLESVEVIDLQSGKMFILDSNDCCFGYRDSVFKKDLKGKILILSVTLRLNKKNEFNILYKDIREKIGVKGINSLTALEISKIVAGIRSSKLPDPGVTGNAGSVFKNPVIPDVEFATMTNLYGSVPSYALPGGQKKIPAAWLIEKCGWKGFRRGQVGVYEKQPLVLINAGNATGKEIYDLIIEIRSSVSQKFNIDLDLEINVI
jgi:UDP-N-acetylmuramate dehydrogenase